MSAKGVLSLVRYNDRSMDGHLPSTKVLVWYDHCCGIHGAMRERRGIKKGTSAARRRNDKAIIARELGAL